jgi:hypothetical protein
MLGALFKGLGSLFEKSLSVSGDVGHFLKYISGYTKQELKEAATASTKEVGRILGRKEQAAARLANLGLDYQEKLMLKAGMSFAKSPRLAENTLRYEKAYASRQRAVNFGLTKLLPAAGFYTAGQVGAAFIENRSEMQKSYLGEKEHTSRYGTSAQTAASIVRGAGNILGIESILGINPIQGTIAGFKQFKKFRKAKAIYNQAKKRAAPYTKIKNTTSPIPSDPVRDRALHRLKTSKKMIKKYQSYMLGVNSAPLVAGATVGAFAYATASGTESPYFLGALGLGLVASPVGRAVGKFVAKYPKESVLAAGVLSAGAAVGVNRPHYAAAEGNITDVSYARESATTKLNYSTAGIVQSIHNNRRKI